ncbi:hypothetical protein KIN34_09880 [Cellulomonas sp. DKR-3]|uniref:Sulfotransferase family protein n=1 Tax=Cellulomonas fulva TaxID=2835530 RepID=A0ABS5TZR1_9CELL|nr:hypothetical protein [Cellulomonas fulva]MBT0994595.1 hypothetical protein [Cellulomonas fulva]
MRTSPGVDALAPGTRLVHIGAPKTGTTSVQGSFAAVRARLPELGVLYPGTETKHKRETDQLFDGGGAALDRLRAELADHPDHRVVVSAEKLSTQLLPQVQAVHELVGEQAHVVLTLRSIGDFLTSLWQQRIKNGEVRDLDEWLQDRLRRIDEYNFLRRDDGLDVASRWAQVFGADRVTVVVLERSSPGRLFEVFEALCALPEGTLDVAELNRGLTWREAQVVRALNVLAARGEADADAVRSFVHLGAVSGLTLDWVPDRDEPKPRLPAWAASAVEAEGERLADAVTASGVRVVGDLAELSRVRVGENAAVTSVPAGAVAAAAHGMLRRTATMVQRRRGSGAA